MSPATENDAENAICLILVDLQNDYFPGGSMELVGMVEATANAKLLLEQARKSGTPVIHIQHIAARPGAAFFVPGTDGAEINPVAEPVAGESIVVKNFPNSFRGTSLLELLAARQVKDLVICGAMSHMCIDATTRAAFDLGFNCTVVADACATRDLQFQERTVKAADVHASFMAALAIPYAKIVTTQEIVHQI
ncbi:cysteine hydrolase family protein [Citrifermentans bremense]|uniref:cysteine hydrolase family protein n=1 Tax=Citrifermentans bremense TaxID=60035 RepID=UPI0004172EFC|nr:cysteine hydrolase family protein [Citrifermentans bremense]